MAEQAPITTPWPLRLQRMRDRLAPLVVFLCAIAATAWLWDRHVSVSSLVGEVQATRLALASRFDGVIVPLADGPIERFDPVEVGQLVARLDDRPILAALGTLRSQIAETRAQLSATAEQLTQLDEDRHRDSATEIRRLSVDVERQRLDVLDRRAAIDVDKVDLRRQIGERDRLKKVVAAGAAPDLELFLQELRVDVVDQRIKSNTPVLIEAEKQLIYMEERLAELPRPEDTELGVVLLPLRAGIQTIESQARELALQVEALEIRAPIAGTIVAVHLHPGQAARIGEPILTIADNQSRYVVVYLRGSQQFQASVGMSVVVQPRLAGVQQFESIIDRIGPTYEEIPPHHRRDPTVLEWGLPVRIPLPESPLLRPGQLVGVLIRPQG